MSRYMAVDQWGQTFWLKTQHPRKELLEMFGRTRAERMFVDTRDGETRHDGYIIAGHWLSVLKVTPAFATI